MERLLGRLRKLDRKGRRAGLANLRGLRIESAYFGIPALPRESVATLHIYSPGSVAPGASTAKNYDLIEARFTELARQALAQDGLVCLRTDDEDYFRQMVEVFSANSSFGLAETPVAEDSAVPVVTDFERNFLARVREHTARGVSENIGATVRYRSKGSTTIHLR